MSEARHPTDVDLLVKILPYLRPQVALYAIALIAAPISAMLVIVQPYLLKVAIDDHILQGDLEGTTWVALQYLVAVLLSFALESTYMLALGYAAVRSIAGLREAVYRHTLSLSRSFFDQQPTGRLLTRATSDVEALGETLTAGAVTIALDVLKVVGILTAMLLLDWQLTLVMTVISPLIFGVVEVIRRVLRRLYLEVRTSLGELNALTSERLMGLQIVQLYSDEVRTLKMFDERLYRYRDATIKTNIWDASLFAILNGLSFITLALMLWDGTGSLLEGAVTAGLLAAFIDYIARLYQPIQEFSQKVAVIQRATSALEKIFGLLDCEEQISEGDTRLTEATGHLVLRDVEFAYGEDAPDVLRGVSLELTPGTVLAVVGRTGSGKSTLGRLLTRAYDNYRGSITLDGTELSKIHPRDVRGIIGSVMQDVQLFPGDVQFNLTLGQELPEERMWECIRMARAEEAVNALGGLQGTVEHAGANLSVGEAQLLSFARTMAQDPPIVIMDEATANVDTLTEVLIQEATQEVLKRKTVLVIAHRLSTIINSDAIAVMDAGRVVELGTHTELMALGGRYAGLFLEQFGEDADESVA